MTGRHLFNIIFNFVLLMFVSSVMAATISDSAITSAVKAKLGTVAPSAITQVNVSTQQGVVNLSGTVDSSSQATQMIETTQATTGVVDVNTNNLNVKGSDQPFTDSYITAKVKGLFIREKLFGEKDIASISIHVETNNGTVYLTGTADSSLQANNAIKLAKSVKGVKNVESSVQVISNS